MKLWLFTSMLANVVMLLWLALVAHSNRLNHEEVMRVEKLHLQDAELVSILFTGKVGKKEFLETMKKYYSPENYFIKKQESGIGINDWFFTFDAKGKLSKVETLSTQGP